MNERAPELTVSGVSGSSGLLSLQQHLLSGPVTTGVEEVRRRRRGDAWTERRDGWDGRVNLLWAPPPCSSSKSYRSPLQDVLPFLPHAATSLHQSDSILE